MRKIKSVLAMLLIATLITSSCKKKDDSSAVSSLQDNLNAGKWKITLFMEDNNDETNHFTGDEIQFLTDGTVTANHTGTIITGSWNTGNDDSNIKLILSFGVAPYTELNEDWHVIAQSSSVILMEHISGGNGGTDVLRFEKI